MFGKIAEWNVGILERWNIGKQTIFSLECGYIIGT